MAASGDAYVHGIMNGKDYDLKIIREFVNFLSGCCIPAHEEQWEGNCPSSARLD